MFNVQVLFKSFWHIRVTCPHHAGVDVLNWRKVQNLCVWVSEWKIRLLAVICGLLMILWFCLDGVWCSDIHPSPLTSSMETDLPDEISIRHIGSLVVWRCLSHPMLHRVVSQNILILSVWFLASSVSATIAKTLQLWRQQTQLLN